MKSIPNIQTLLTQAPYVTIQELFQENTLEQITSIHKFLQENIRTQGIGLKKIFESKYMDLVNCSELLEKVNNFSLKIDNLAMQIKETVTAERKQDSNITKRADKIVQTVESLVRKNKFTESITQCLSYKLKQPILYEVVLLETVQTIMHKTLNKITQEGLFDILEALVLFQQNEGSTYLEDEKVEEEYGSTLAILAKHYKKVARKSTRCYLLAAINSLFEIKIKESCIDKSSTQFSNFVDDLLTMISLIQSGFSQLSISVKDEGEEQLSLSDVQNSYKSNFERIKSSLSKQMISSKNNRITFNFDFYNAMLSDHQLLEKFELLERKLSSTNTISQVLGRLWSDFYHQFIDYVLKELNTFEWVYHEISGLLQQKLVFPEFKRHLKDNFASNMLAQGRKYKEQARLLLSEVSNLIKLCSKQDGDALLNHFRTQMKIYLEENAQHFVELFESLSDNNQRLKTSMVTLIFQTYFIGNVLHLDSHEIMRSIIEDSQIKIQEALKTVLVQYAQNIPFHENIERMFEDLQEVCMPLVVYLKEKEEKQSFKIFILWLLESIETTLEGRNKQKVNYTISFLLNKNTISQHQPLFHFIPKVLFNIKDSTQNQPFNISYYEGLLQAQPSQRVTISSNIPPRSNKDLFDIGQKQPPQKTSNKLIALGNQFVGGLMNKIRQ